jgi:antitoxin (DNA-binding transcriptional repressor) of toxin-antitoxin stability system
MLRQISIQKRDVKWDELLALAEEGTEVLVLEGNHPLVKVTPVDDTNPIPPETLVSQSRKRLTNAFPGAIVLHDDFDDPLPDEFWFGEEP